MKPNEEKQKELDSDAASNSGKKFSYKASINFKDKGKDRRRRRNGVGSGANTSSRGISNTGQGRLDSAEFVMHKGSTFLDNTLNDSILNTGGINLEGLTVTNANLNTITTAGKLPIFGENLYVDGALEDGAFGDSGYILQEIVNELPFIKNSVGSINDFNDAMNNMHTVTASMPFTMTKLIKHNYRAMDDISSDSSKMTNTKTLYFEDMANVMQTFMDTYGTKYVVNDLTIHVNGSDAPAFPYIAYYYDIVMLHVMSVFRHYENFRSALHYGEKVSVIRNDVLNAMDGPIFKSSTMIGAQSSAISALTKLPLPLKYHLQFMSSVYNNGKVTSGRVTPMEYVNCDVVKPVFKDITNSITKLVYIPSKVWTEVWDKADAVIKAYDLVELDRWIFNPKNVNNWDVIAKRSELIKVWNNLTQALNLFYNQMIDYIIALQRGLKASVITSYTNPDNIRSQVSGIVAIQEAAKGINGNNAMINAYNYVNSLVTTEMNNGVLIKGDFVPDLMLKGIISHDSVLIFMGEEQQYVKMYDTSEPVFITINNPTYGPSKNDSLLYFKLKADNPADLSSGRWRLFNINTTNGQEASQAIKFNHPFIHYLLGNTVINLVFTAKLPGVSGGESNATTVVQDSRVYTTLQYTVNTIGKYISNVYKYWSTR